MWPAKLVWLETNFFQKIKLIRRSTIKGQSALLLLLRGDRHYVISSTRATKREMQQVVLRCTFRELELRYETGTEPGAFLHLRSR